MTMKEQAIKYLKQGFSIIPIEPKGKVPLISWTEFKKRQPTADEVNDWFSKWPDMNIGIVTGDLSGIAVIDIDSEEALVFAKSKGLPNGPMAKSGKGHHFYCRQKDGLRGFQNLDDLPSIDLRAEGNIIVASPSIHQSGHKYCWVSGYPFKKSELPEVPEWIISKNSGKKITIKSFNGGGEGVRNNTLTSLVGQMFKKGMTKAQVLKKASELNQENKPPMDDTEVQTIVNSIEKAEFNSIANSNTMVIKKKYKTIDQLITLKLAEVDWVWENYLAKGYITLLSGWPKAGKTTLLFGLIKALKTNQPFIDLKTKLDGKILIVTEENSQLYQVRILAANLSGEDVLILPAFEVDCYTKEKVMEQIYIALDQESLSLIIIDTLGEFWGVTDENSAPMVIQALKSFKTIAQSENVSILLIHHLRKGNGDYGTAHRGSGALLGAVDIGMEYKYTSDRIKNRRIITAKSRFSQTPEDLMVEFDKSNGNFTSLGDSEQFKREDVKRRFLEALSDNAHENLETIKKKIDPEPGNTLLGEIAKDCRQTKLVDFTGEGKKGKPYLYKKLSATNNN